MATQAQIARQIAAIDKLIAEATKYRAALDRKASYVEYAERDFLTAAYGSHEALQTNEVINYIADLTHELRGDVDDLTPRQMATMSDYRLAGVERRLGL